MLNWQLHSAYWWLSTLCQLWTIETIDCLFTIVQKDIQQLPKCERSVRSGIDDVLFITS